MAFTKSTILPTFTGQSTALTTLVDCITDPVDSGISANSLVEWINKDNLKVLVGRILSNPVGIENTQILASSTNTLFSNSLQASSGLQLGDSLARGLSVHLSLVHWSLAASTANAHSVDAEALLGLVSQATCFVDAGWAGLAVDDVQLTQEPGTDTLEVTVDISLLSLGEFFNVFVRTH